MRRTLTWTLASFGALVLAGCGPQSAQSAGEPVSEPSTPVTASTTTEPTEVVQSGVECPTSDPNAQPIRDGLPASTLPCLGPGPDVNLAGLRGTPVVLNVWASWCPPCRAEMPYLTGLARDAGDSLIVLGVDVQDSRAAGTAYAEQVGLASVFDESGKTRVTLGWSGPPVTYLVKADGTIAHTQYGAFPDAESLREAVATHLGVRVEPS